MAERVMRSEGEGGRRRRRRRRAEQEDAAAPEAEQHEVDGAERVLSALGNQRVQRLLRGADSGDRQSAVQRQDEEDEATSAEADSEEAVEEGAPADIYELSPDVVATGSIVNALVQGALGDLEGGGPQAEENANEKEWEALAAIDEVQPEVEGFGNDLLLARLRGLRQSVLLDTTILRPYVGEDAVGLDSAQNHLRNVSALFASQFSEETARESAGIEEPPETEPNEPGAP